MPTTNIFDMKCDFCSAPNPQWAYRTKQDPTEATTKGAWLACDECKELIEKGNHNGLARRSAVTFREKAPELKVVPLKDMVYRFKGFHDAFRKARTGRVMRVREFMNLHPSERIGQHVDEFMHEEGFSMLMGKEDRPGDPIARPVPSGSPILHREYTDEGEVYFSPEGFTPEQLSDPRTIEYLMSRIQRDRATPNIPLTVPAVREIKQWVGARTYMQACAAVYGDCPRPDDHFTPRPPMMLSQRVLEPLLGAHPVVLEPEQMNAIEDSDWSFAEAIEYAKIAHLPFEPIYLDFGGHHPVMVDLEAGPCRLYGAVIWRSGFFKTPTLAVAPIGGFEYLTQSMAGKLLAEGAEWAEVTEYCGITPEEVKAHKRRGPSGQELTGKEFTQWPFQTCGICWFGVETPDVSAYATMGMTIRQQRGESKIPMVFSTGEAIAHSLGEERLMKDPAHTQAQILTGLYDDPSEEHDANSTWTQMARMGTEMVARLCERALLGLYFLENAPVRVEPVSLSRPERREMERERKKRRHPGEIASIVVINGRRSEGGSGEGMAREHEYRWERRGHFHHIHSNNRHYQNRPDLVKPCPKCSLEYADNERARREGRELPYPHCESPDCIPIWIHPTVCGPEGKPLKKKVRIRRQDTRRDEAA